MTRYSENRDVGKDAFRVGEWIVEPSLNVLRRNGRREAIEPRLISLLTFLAARRGQVASKQEILDSVWKGVTTTDESLSQAVFKLRKILGDDPERPIYIETIRKKGYRLVAKVVSVEGSRRRIGKSVAVIGAIATVAIIAIVPERQSNVPATQVVMLETRPVTSRPGRERDPSISSDGQYIVYSATDAAGASQIYLHGVGRGTQDRQLTNRDNNGSPVFLPDDERIAFLRTNGGRCTAMMMTLVDGAERVLGDCTGNGYRDAAASRDGRWLAFNAREEDMQPFSIYLLDVESGTRHAVTSPSGGIWGDFDSAFTPDGRSLAFSRSIAEGMQDIYLLDLDNGRETQLTDEGRNVFGIAIDNDRILYGTNLNGRYAIWSMGIDGSDRQLLPIRNTGIVNPSISSNGATLVYEKIEREVNLTVVEFGAAGHSTLLSFNAEILHPDYSPADERIAYSSNRSGHYEIWDTDVAGQNLRRLTRFESGFTAHPKYSPDGQRIAFDARPKSFSQVFVMNADGSQLRALTDENMNAYSPTWSRDGESLLFAMETNGTLEIFRCAIETGTIERVTTTGGIYAVEGADGQIFHIRPGRDGIWVPGTGESQDPIKMSPKPDAADWGNWSVTEDGIIYYDRESTSLNLLDTSTGGVEVLANIAGNVPTADPAVAIDAGGGRAFVSLRRRLESDLDVVKLPVRNQ